MINVLYLCHAPDNLGGAALSLFNLIKSVQNQVNSIVVLEKEGAVSAFFRKKGIECIIAPFPCNIKNNKCILHVTTFVFKYLSYCLRNVKSRRIIKKALCGRKIDIVHSNSSVFIFGDILARTLKVKHVWHFREFQDIDFDMHPFLGMKDLVRRMQSADSLIAITKAVYDHWDFSRYPNACYLWDAVRSKNDCVEILEKDKYFLFCAALLSKTKGIESVLKAFGLSGVANYGYKLKIIGKCNSESYMCKLRNIAKDYGICDKIEFLGYKEDVKPYMEKATAFLMASENEGLGRVTIEAMFYGCLVIARHSGGTLEFLKEGFNGLYFNDDVQLASTMKDVSMILPVEIIKNAQKFVVNNFSEEIYGAKMVKIYNHIL